MCSRVHILTRIRSFDDFLMLCHSLLLLAAVPLILRLNLAKVGSLLEPKASRRERLHGKNAAEIVSFIDEFIRCTRALIRSRCLTRGIVLYYFLRRVNVGVSLVFGMGKVNGEFVGHCWLSKGGEPFGEAVDPRPLFTIYYIITAADQPSVGPLPVAA